MPVTQSAVSIAPEHQKLSLRLVLEEWEMSQVVEEELQELIQDYYALQCLWM